MKKYLSWLTVAACAAAMTVTLTACDEEDPVTVTPKVVIKEGTPSETALTFTLSTADAQEVAYMVVKKGESVPEAAAILETGTKGQSDAAKEYTADGLDPETAYVIAAAAVNGNVYSAVAKTEMVTLPASAPEPDPERPVVEIEAGEATASTLTFTLVPAHAQEVAYVVVKKGEAVSDAAAILETGIKGQADGEKEYTADGLERNTAYVIAAAAVNGEVYSDVAAAEMTTGQYDEELKATFAIADYLSNDFHPGKDIGQFVLGLDDITWDSQGYAASAGSHHQFCFYSDQAADPENPVPLDGTHTFVSGVDSGEKWTIGDNNYNWWFKTDEQGKKIMDGLYSEAEMTLTRSGDTYEVVMTGVTDMDKTFRATYNGVIKFTNRAKPDEDDQNLEATYAEGIYYGTGEDNPDSDGWLFKLYDDRENPTMKLTIDCWSEIYGDPMNPVIPNGTFVVNNGNVTTPGTFNPGGNIWGFVDYGTYLWALEDGNGRSYYVSGGEFTVTGSGDNITVDCNFTTDKAKITASFTGPFNISFKYKPPLTEDLNVVFDRIEEATYFGRTYEGAYNYTFTMADCEFNESVVPADGGEGNRLTLDLYSATGADPGNVIIPDGTYVLARGSEAGMVSTQVSGATHWYENGLSSDVKFESGTVEVSRTDAVYTVYVDAVTTENTKYAATYTGEITMASIVSAPRPDRKGMLYSESAAYPVKPSRSALSGRNRGPQSFAGDSERMRFDRLVR